MPKWKIRPINAVPVNIMPLKGFDSQKIPIPENGIPQRKDNASEGLLELQKRRQQRRRPTRRWKKCNPVRKKKRQL